LIRIKSSIFRNIGLLSLKAAFFLTLIILSGCSGSKSVITTETDSVRYSLISIIHADANYLYHVDGQAKKANDEALKESIETAQNAKHGEVFIFHQKPERKAFFLFPRKDRVFYHYRNGSLINKGSYSPLDGGLSAEAEIYRTHSTKKDRKEYLIYFGHEIPTFKDRHYHRSMPDMNFDTDIFTSDLKKFSSRFDVTILSTCNNGNPYMMERLQSITDVAVASPQNLHLSYMSMEKFDLLEKNASIPNPIFADFFAHNAFEKLSSNLSTMVTISTYWLSGLNKDLPEISKLYEKHLTNTSIKPFFTDNIDCQNLDIYNEPLHLYGMLVLYKPPAFGRNADKKTHSGWGCKE
jgi:hypothetical protein|tara:strand:+ start:2468 stop:3520 length:1053 start_codon:yes stop_codon:yes gene_type:complete